MKAIEFIEVGRNKLSWTCETEEEVDYEFLYNQVKVRGGLLSSVIDFTDDGEIFVGGFRKVGTFKVKEISYDK